MKKQSAWMLAAMTLSALVTSCSSDDAIVDVSSSDLVDVTYTVSTEALTRAAHDNDGDASKITRYICEVYIKGTIGEQLLNGLRRLTMPQTASPPTSLPRIHKQ